MTSINEKADIMRLDIAYESCLIERLVIDGKAFAARFK